MRYFVDLMQSNSATAMSIWPLLVACGVLVVAIVVLTIIKKRKDK